MSVYSGIIGAARLVCVVAFGLVVGACISTGAIHFDSSNGVRLFDGEVRVVMSSDQSHRLVPAGNAYQITESSGGYSEVSFHSFGDSGEYYVAQYIASDPQQSPAYELFLMRDGRYFQIAFNPVGLAEKAGIPGFEERMSGEYHAESFAAISSVFNQVIAEMEVNSDFLVNRLSLEIQEVN